MANIWELSVGVSVDQWSLKKATKSVQTEFKKTGDKMEKSFSTKTISDIEKKFNNITNEIQNTRKELVKMWKDTKGLDKIEKDINDINKEFTKGKISAKEYGIAMDKLSKKIESSDNQFKSIAKSVKIFAVATLANLWVQAVGQMYDFLKNSVLEFAKFEKGLSRINTVAWVSAIRLESLWNEIKNISSKLAVTNEELLNTAFNISSAGVEFENITSILELSAITAIGAWTDTETAFNGIIAVVKKYGLNLNESADIAEKFFIANKLGQTTVQDMAQAIQNLSSVAKPAGVSVNEVFAVLSALTGVTGNANQVMTQLNGAMNALSAPTTEASAKMKELGIEVWATVIEERWFVTVAKDLFDAVGGDVEQLRKLVPEVEATKLIIALATEQNEKFNVSLNAMEDGTGWLKDAFAEMSDDMDFKLKVAQNNIDNFTLKLWQMNSIWLSYVIDFARWISSAFSVIYKSIKLPYDLLVDFFVDYKKIFSAMARFKIDDPSTWGFTWAFERTRTSIQWIRDDYDSMLKWFWGDNALEDYVNDVTNSVDWMDQSFWSAVETIEKLEKQGLKTIKKLEWEITKYKDSLKWLSIWSKEFIETKDNIEILEKELSKATESYKEIEKVSTEKAKEIVNTEKEKNKKISKELNNLKWEYDEVTKVFNKNIDSQKKKMDELSDKTKSLSGDIQGLKDDLGDLETGRAETLGERNLEILEREKEIQQEIQDIRTGDQTTESLQEKIKLEEELTKLLAEKRLVQENATDKELEEAKRLAELSPTALFLEEFALEKTALEEKRLLKEQELLETEERLQKEKVEYFNLLDSKSVFDQNYKEQRISIEQEITDAVILGGIKQIAVLEEVRKKAIQAAQAMRSASIPINPVSIGQGFASGGYTGDGGSSQVAGVVHKWEWVAPKWMVNSMKPLFQNLENSRTRGFENGGNTSTTNKTQTNNITVNSSVDLRGFMDYAKWKL